MLPTKVCIIYCGKQGGSGIGKELYKVWNHMLLKNRQVGFGLTKEDAEKDWYINMCREDIANDTEHWYTDRVAELSAWLPTESLLHISGVGCLEYRKGVLREERSGKSVPVRRKGYSIYSYLTELFGDSLSYEDIAVCIQEPLTKFFRGISEEFHPLREYPFVKVAERNEQFNPEVIYMLRNGVIVGSSKDIIGMKLLGDEQYHLLELDVLQNRYDAMMYLRYRLGITLEEGGLGIGEGDKEL